MKARKVKKYYGGGGYGTGIASTADTFLTFKNKTGQPAGGATNTAGGNAALGLMGGMNLGGMIDDGGNTEKLQNVKGAGSATQIRDTAKSVVGSFGPWGQAISQVIGVQNKVSDKMKDFDCDPVTGECVDVTRSNNKAKSILANNIDPLASSLGAIKSVGEGDFGGVIDGLTLGLTNFSKKDEKKAAQFRKNKILMEKNQMLGEKNAFQTSRRADELARMRSNPNAFGYQQSLEKGGRVAYFHDDNPLYFKEGGKWMNKLKLKKGSFTAYCKSKGFDGVTSKCIAMGKKSDNPTTVKRATLAETFRKTKH